MRRNGKVSEDESRATIFPIQMWLSTQNIRSGWAVQWGFTHLGFFSYFAFNSSTSQMSVIPEHCHHCRGVMMYTSYALTRNGLNSVCSFATLRVYRAFRIVFARSLVLCSCCFLTLHANQRRRHRRTPSVECVFVSTKNRRYHLTSFHSRLLLCVRTLNTCDLSENCTLCVLVDIQSFWW